MRLRPSPNALSIVVFCLALFSFKTSALTVEQLRATPDLTPGKFASYFSSFEYEFRAEVQSPEVFLATRSGDCDDYATLAAEILKEKGYTPRLISVRMPKVTHVVCYIEETNSYLDYNFRGFWNRTVTSAPDIASIAARVARSYRSSWTSASEFTFESGVKRLVTTVLEPGRNTGRFAALFR